MYWFALSICTVAVFLYIQFNDFIFSHVLLPAQNVLSAPVTVQPGATLDQDPEFSSVNNLENLQSWFFWMMIAIIIAFLCFAVFRALSRHRMLWTRGIRSGSGYREHDVHFLHELELEKKLLEKAKRRRDLTDIEEVLLENIKDRIKILKHNLV